MLEEFFKPTSIAIIGASREPGKVGHEILRNILESGFKGKVFPINPKAEEIFGLKCYPSVLNVPREIDLGVIVVPATIVPMVVEEAGKKGIKALIIISAGFREAGGEGTKLEDEIVKICEKHRIRILGPNCLGVTDTYTPLNTSFAPNMPPKGRIALVSQSGALGAAILDWILDQRIGFSKFVSLGNKADLDETDIISALADDEETSIILLYLEGVKRGNEFIKVAQEVTRKKPIVILKSGITAAGARAASSHTGTMAGSDSAFDTAFRKAGVIRVETAEELFDLAEVFSTQPIPDGPNAAIITNAGGPGILAADACEKYGLKTAPMSSEIVEKLRGKLPPASAFFNPVDVLGDASAERYRFAAETVLGSGDVDVSLIILTPQAMTEPLSIAKAIIGLKQAFKDKPLVTSFMGGRAVVKAVEELEESGIPNYEFPERAIRSLSALVKYCDYLKRSPVEVTPRFRVNYAKASSIFEKVRSERRVTLTGAEAAEVANSYGIPTPLTLLAPTAEEAVLSANRIGYPVVLKIESPRIHHKTDIGGVKLNVSSEEDARRTFYELVGRAHIFYPKATVLGVNVQKMVSPGREMIIGINRDITFGPLIMFGLGGIYVNFLKDVAFGLAPLTERDAVEMIKQTKAYTLLRGVRGEAVSDIDSIVDVLLRISQLVTDFSEINELDINPLIAYEEGKGCLALDVKITI
jgi:acetyl coenzyme A synthetase (ADP forming)-like protein